MRTEDQIVSDVKTITEIALGEVTNGRSSPGSVSIVGMLTLVIEVFVDIRDILQAEHVRRVDRDFREERKETI